MSHVIARGRPRLAIPLAFLLFASTILVAFAMNSNAPAREAGALPLFSAFTEVEICDSPGPCSIVEVSLASDWDGDGGVLCATSTLRSRIEHGCAVVRQSFGLGTDAITWAEVPDTRVDLYETRCNDRFLCQDVLMRTITVEALWSGEGETLRFDQSFGRHYGACSWPDNIGGFVRTASLILRIDGDPVRAFGNIRVVDGANMPVTTCSGSIR